MIRNHVSRRRPIVVLPKYNETTELTALYLKFIPGGGRKNNLPNIAGGGL